MFSDCKKGSSTLDDFYCKYLRNSKEFCIFAVRLSHGNGFFECLRRRFGLEKNDAWFGEKRCMDWGKTTHALRQIEACFFLLISDIFLRECGVNSQKIQTILLFNRPITDSPSLGREIATYLMKHTPVCLIFSGIALHVVLLNRLYPCPTKN